MDTRHLRAFLKIAETASISRAAEGLGLSQPSLSQQLLRLEDELGCKLFERTARGVTLTETGRAFDRHARQILESADRAVAEMRELRAQARARVTIAMTISISKLVGVALAEAAMERGSAVSLRLVEASSSQIREMIEAGKVDLGLLFDVAPLDTLSIKPVSCDEVFLIGPPGKWPPLDGASSFPPEGLASLALIVPGPQNGLRQFLEQAAQRFGFRLHIASEIDALQHIAGLVADGRGYSVLPLSAVEHELGTGAVSAIRIGEGFRRTLYMARRPDAPVTPAIKLVEDMALQMVADIMARRSGVAALGLDAPQGKFR